MGENTKTIKMKKIPLTKLSNEDAKTFFLQEKNYCTIKLPNIISFQSLLDKLQSTDYNVKAANNYDNVNCKMGITLVDSTNPQFLHIINPCIYVKIVQLVTDNQNWLSICKRIDLMRSHSKIICISFPTKNDTHRGVGQPSRILSVNEELNILTVKHSINYAYAADLKLIDCFKDLYTHSIAWALDGYKRAKNAKIQITHGKDNLLGDKIASLIQQSTYGQTNGIPQGSLLMDFIVELVLAYADLCISLFVKCFNRNNANNPVDDYRIIRNRSTYRIFAKTHNDVERICHIINSTVSDLNFQTDIDRISITNRMISNALSVDKAKVTIFPKEEYPIYHNILLLHELSMKYPNSTVLKLSIRCLSNITEDTKYMINDIDIEQVIPILIDIAYHNLAIIDMIIPLTGEIISLEPSIDKRDEYYNLVQKKFDALPNSDYIQIWVQYLGLIIGHTDYSRLQQFQERITGSNLWNMGWAEPKLKNIIEQIPIVVS